MTHPHNGFSHLMERRGQMGTTAYRFQNTVERYDQQELKNIFLNVNIYVVWAHQSQVGALNKTPGPGSCFFSRSVTFCIQTCRMPSYPQTKRTSEVLSLKSRHKAEKNEKLAHYMFAIGFYALLTCRKTCFLYSSKLKGLQCACFFFLFLYFLHEQYDNSYQPNLKSLLFFW